MTTYPVQTTDFETGIDILLIEGTTPWFGTGAGATTMTGGAADAYARNKATLDEVVCADCDVVGATSVRANFGAEAVPAGSYLVRIYGTPLGYARKLIYEGNWVVRE